MTIIITGIILLLLTIIIIMGSKGSQRPDTESKSSIKKENSNASKEIEYVDKLSVSEESNKRFKDWEVRHNQAIKEELEKIDNGEYNEFRYIEFNIAGIHYRTDLAKDTINSLDILCDISLIKEPDNQHDHNAVKVVYDRKRLGYIPMYHSMDVTKLINENLIKKVYVMDSGRDYTLEYPDALFITLRIYYIPSPEVLKREEDERLKIIAEQEYKAQRMQMQVEIPTWMEELSTKINNVQIDSVELRRLKDNIRNSIRAYEKAVRMEKENVVNNATERLLKYKKDLEMLLPKH